VIMLNLEPLGERDAWEFLSKWLTIEYLAEHYYTDEQIADARYEISSCQWADLDDDDVIDMSSSEIIAGINRNYAGGWIQFIKDGS